MNISNAKYVAINDENDSITATIDGKVMSIPLDPANRHYQEILEWAKIDGNTIEDAD
tara:strand:- start:207 stop:377 length:171 start_codon:yes stop_codon:yes gene_type:complete